jgi:hypothetical protein
VVWSVTALFLLVPLSHLTERPILPVYAAVAGLLQALVSWFLLRRESMAGPAHLTSLLAGAGALALPFSVALLVDGGCSFFVLFSAVVCQLCCMLVGWFVLVFLLVPVTWMARGQAAEGDLMSQERAMLVSGAALGTFLLSDVAQEKGLVSLFLPFSFRPVDRLIGMLLVALLLLLAVLRIVARTWWLARVGRGLVPGWMIARGEDCIRYVGLPRTDALSRLPRWDGLSDRAVDGVLVYTVGEEAAESFRQASSAVPVAVLADSGLPWHRTPQSAWLLKLVLLTLLWGSVLATTGRSPSQIYQPAATANGRGGAPPSYHPPPSRKPAML